MDNRITTLAAELTEVDSRIGDYVTDLGKSGLSYDGIMEKLHAIMRTAVKLREGDKG